VLAALFHRLVLKDEVLQSMLPWRSTNAAADASVGNKARGFAVFSVSTDAAGRPT